MKLWYIIGMTTSIIDVGARVRRLRESISMNQSGLAKAIAREIGREDFTQGSISAIERGDRLPSVPVLIALAKVLETSTDYLLGLTDNPNPVNDVDDQAIAIMDLETRQTLQELSNIIAGLSVQDRKFVLDVVRRLVAPARPTRIIGK